VRRDAVRAAYFILIVEVKVAIPRENMVSFPRLETTRNIHPRGELVPYIYRVRQKKIYTHFNRWYLCIVFEVELNYH